MKTIGMLGGMSWESTLEYYRVINRTIAQRLGGLHSARCILWSFEFDEIHGLQVRGQWETATQQMVDAGRALKQAGADFLVICTNTMHKMADAVERNAGLPLLHIADATGERIRAAGHRVVGLIGTRFTMEEDFYRGRMAERFGLEVLIPREPQRQQVHDIIFDELCRGEMHAASRDALLAMIGDLSAAGCQAVILGCTELGLLVKPADSRVPLYDTTIIHAESAAEHALR